MKETKEKTQKKKNKKSEISANSTEKSQNISTRGRIFEGKVIKKFPKRLVVEFDRFVYIKKFERFLKKRTRLHARLPENLVVEIGDLVRVGECRPLSKMIHFIVLEKLSLAKSQIAESLNMEAKT